MDTIKQLISNGETEEAIRRLDTLITQDSRSDEAYFLRGRAYAKRSDFQHALNDYLMAMDINPASPAVEAHAILMKIMNFYNKDMFNH